MQNRRKHQYFTAIYTAVPYHSSTIAQNRYLINQQRRNFNKKSQLIHDSLRESVRLQNQITYSQRLSDYKGRRQSDDKRKLLQKCTNKALQLSTKSFREGRKQLKQEKRIIAQGDIRTRERLNKSSARARQCLTLIRKPF